MFRKLLVPLDGSELAERALPYAVSIARANGATLTLARVALAPAPAHPDGAGWEADQAEAIATAEQYLTTIADRLRTRVPVETMVPYGRAVSGIREAIAESAPDAVVMATHGRTGLSHLLLGSVAEATIAVSA